MESVNKYESREIDSTKVISDTNLISLTDGVDRSNDHYDACVKAKSPEIHNVITYCSDIHKNLQFCAVKSGSELSNIYATTYEEPIRVDGNALHNQTKNLSGIADTIVCSEPYQASCDSCNLRSENYDGYISFSPDEALGDNDVDNKLPLRDIKQLKLRHPKNLIVSHYNVNSIRNKIYEIMPLLHEHLVDILAIAETKIDHSFPHDQFHMPNYKLYRQDRNCHGGGGSCYI